MAKRSRGRVISGIILLDKPSGITSNAALQKVKRLYQAAKAGHTGTLDPFATGMLPICLGEATKVATYLSDASKAYAARISLGMQTSTGDPEGEPVDQANVPELDREDFLEALATFEGEIEQVPPMYSALKSDGRRLYELAREGVEVERPARAVKIFQLSLVDHGPDWLDIEVVCSKGTYIRVLAEDLARALGTVGHCASLRRLVVGPFGGGDTYTLDQLALKAEHGHSALDDLLMSADAALGHLPALKVPEQSLAAVRNGNLIEVAPERYQGLVRIYDPEHQFLGIGELLGNTRMQPKRMLVSN